MATYRVQLSEQDLADFLDDNPKWSEQYRAELERRTMTTIEKVTPATTTRATKEVYTDLGPTLRKVQRYIEQQEDWVLVEEFEQVWQFPYGWIAKRIG